MNKNTKQITAILFIALYFSGCTSLETIRLKFKVSSHPNVITQGSTVLEVQFVPQPDAKLCGIAVVEMLTGYYQNPIDPLHRENLIHIALAENGLTGIRIKDFLAKKEYFTAILPGTLNHEITGLYYHLDKRHPLIVMLGSKNTAFFHYVTVIGYNPILKNIVLLDPARGQHIVSEGYFIEKWQMANRFMLVAYPNN